MILISRN